jgi:hypothetical protein
VLLMLTAGRSTPAMVLVLGLSCGLAHGLAPVAASATSGIASLTSSVAQAPLDPVIPSDPGVASDEVVSPPTLGSESLPVQRDTRSGRSPRLVESAGCSSAHGFHHTLARAERAPPSC